MYFFDHQIFCSQAYGGVSRYWFELYRAMSLISDQEITLFSGVHFSRMPLEELSPRIQLIGKKLPFVPRHGSKYLRAANGLYCRKLLHDLRPKIYHPTYFEVIPSPKTTGRVVTVHDMIYEKFRGNNHPSSIQKKYSLDHADRVICVSKATRNDLLEYFPHLENRCSVIYHGTSKLPSPCNPPAIPAQPYLLFVGCRRKYKNFICLVKAMQQLSQSGLKELHLVCFGGEIWDRSEREALASAGLMHRVHEIQGDDSVLAAAYSRASMLVYCSLYEGFGLPILEALSVGCPVVCSRSSSLPEVAGDAALYFDPNSPDELAARIRAVFEDGGLAARMKIKGIERARFFSWEKAALETEKVYSSLFCSERP